MVDPQQWIAAENIARFEEQLAKERARAFNPDGLPRRK